MNDPDAAKCPFCGGPFDAANQTADYNLYSCGTSREATPDRYVSKRCMCLELEHKRLMIAALKRVLAV